MEPCWAQGVINGCPVTINGRRVPVKILVQAHEKTWDLFPRSGEIYWIVSAPFLKLDPLWLVDGPCWLPLRAAILSATSTEKPCSWSCPLQDTRRGGWDVVDCCETLVFGTVWEVLLTLVTGVGSLLRATLGPKTRASLASLRLWKCWGNFIAWFFGITLWRRAVRR